MYLWINITDLDSIGKIPGIGSPVLMFIRNDLGDNLLSGSWYNRERLDESYIIIETNRPNDIVGGIEVIGRRKLGRKPRTRITNTIPKDGWKHI